MGDDCNVDSSVIDDIIDKTNGTRDKVTNGTIDDVTTFMTIIEYV